jgi:hypothetical protein
VGVAAAERVQPHGAVIGWVDQHDVSAALHWDALQDRVDQVGLRVDDTQRATGNHVLHCQSQDERRLPGTRRSEVDRVLQAVGRRKGQRPIARGVDGHHPTDTRQSARNRQQPGASLLYGHAGGLSERPPDEGGQLVDRQRQVPHPGEAVR